MHHVVLGLAFFFLSLIFARSPTDAKPPDDCPAGVLSPGVRRAMRLPRPNQGPSFRSCGVLCGKMSAHVFTRLSFCLWALWSSWPRPLSFVTWSVSVITLGCPVACRPQTSTKLSLAPQPSGYCVITSPIRPQLLYRSSGAASLPN